MGVDWSSACQVAVSTSLQRATLINYCFCGVLIAGFCLSTAYSARQLLRYLKLDAKDGVWRLYATFAALMCCGSIIGAISWIARMQELYFLYVSEDENRSGNFAGFLSDQSRKYYWKAVFGLLYPLEFAFLSIAKLTVLDRLVAFAVPISSAAVEFVSLRKKLTFVFRATIFTAVTGSVVGFCGNIASAVYCVRIGNMSSELQAMIVSNTSAPDQPGFYDSPLVTDIVATLKLNDRALSVQLYCELVVLIVIVAVFAVVGAICVKRIRTAKSGVAFLNSGALEQVQKSARTLKVRVVTTVTVIFFAFTLRSVFAIMYALANNLANITGCSSCGGGACNSYDDMKRYLLRSPQFQSIVIFIASPVTLSIALWGMTTNKTLQAARQAGRQVPLSVR